MQAGQLIKKIKTVKFYKKRNQRNIYVYWSLQMETQKMHLKKGSKKCGWRKGDWDSKHGPKFLMRFIDLRFIFIGRHAEINEPSMAAGQKGDPERVCGLNGVCRWTQG